MISPEHFGAGMDDHGAPNPWIPGENPGELMPKLVHRRAKRIIPEDEKDEKYWEKRKRNNMAAKRSRENKRQLEIEIRNKVSFLEEDNALLRKEVMMIKARFGLPMDQSVLTPEERAQCLQEVKNAQAAAAEASQQDRVDHVSSTSPGVYPVSMVSVSHQDDHDLSGHGRVMSDPRSNSHSPGDGQHKVQIKEEPSMDGSDGVFVPNGQSVYGPFNPPVVWGPTGQQHSAGHHPGYGGMHGMGQQPQQHQQQQQQQHQSAYGGVQGGQTKLPSIGNAFHDKSDPYGHRYGNNPTAVTNGLTTTSAGAVSNNSNSQYGTDTRTPYDYFMAAAYSQGQAIYSPANNSSMLSAPTPADLSLATRGDKHHHNDATGLVDKSSLPDGAQVPQSMANGHLNGLGSLGGVSASMASHRDSMLHGNSAEELLGVGDHGVGGGRGGQEGGQDRDKLAQENDELKMHIRKLTAQMEHMKKVAMKN